MLRGLAYGLMTVSLGAAVFLYGGVVPVQWAWCALGVSIAALLSVSVNFKQKQSKLDRWGFGCLALVLGWMLFQLVPLPPFLIERLSPEHWRAVMAARAATGQNPQTWIALSLAPPATIGRLLDVIPATAAFVAAREMAEWWQGGMWLAVAPVIAIAWLESVLGLLQFYFMRTGGSLAGSATGTYVNRDHFAGLVEIAFPLAVMAAIAVWRKGANRLDEPAGVALRTAGLLGIAACLLMATVVSLSRMGFISILMATALTTLVLLASRRRSPSTLAEIRVEHPRAKWRWLVFFAVPLCIIVFLPTRELILRFADLSASEEISKDTRMEIWQDTLRSVSAFKWTGCGLGAYERGLYRFKTVVPINTVDFAHNDYLQILAELGIIGSVLVAGLLVWIIWKPLSVVLSGRGSENWELAVGLLAALFAFGLHSLADFNLYIPANALALAWLAGVAVSPRLEKG